MTGLICCLSMLWSKVECSAVQCSAIIGSVKRRKRNDSRVEDVKVYYIMVVVLVIERHRFASVREVELSEDEVKQVKYKISQVSLRLTAYKSSFETGTLLHRYRIRR